MSLASWFTSTAYVASLASTSSYGSPTYGPKRALRCRVEVARRVSRRASGEEVVFTHTLYTDALVLPTDRIWLPGVSTATDDGARTPAGVTANSDKAGMRTLYQVDF